MNVSHQCLSVLTAVIKSPPERRLSDETIHTPAHISQLQCKKSLQKNFCKPSVWADDRWKQTNNTIAELMPGCSESALRLMENKHSLHIETSSPNNQSHLGAEEIHQTSAPVAWDGAHSRWSAGGLVKSRKLVDDDKFRVGLPNFLVSRALTPANR